MKTATLTDARAHLSKLVADVSRTGHSVLITCRGRPMAKLVPVHAHAGLHPARIRGWLDADDPFFDAIEVIVADRVNHKPGSFDP